MIRNLPRRWRETPMRALGSVIALVATMCLATGALAQNSNAFEDNETFSDDLEENAGNNNLSNTNVGSNNLGSNNLGNNSLGNNSLGNNSLGNNSLGNNNIRRSEQSNDSNTGNNSFESNNFGLAGNEDIFGETGESGNPAAADAAEPTDPVTNESAVTPVIPSPEVVQPNTNELPEAEELVTAEAEATAASEPEPAAPIDGLKSDERELVRSRIAELKPRPVGTYPEDYIVQPGDTLWDICDQLLDDPFWWPKLWSFNANILNPHLIEPGMRIVFAPSDGVMPPSLPIADTGEFLPAKLTSATFKPEENPNVEAWADLKGTMISPDEVSEFKLMDIYESAAASAGNMVMLPGLLTSTPPETVSTIDGVGGLSLAPGKGGIVYSRRSSSFRPAPGERFVAMRQQDYMAVRDLDESRPPALWIFSGVVAVLRNERSGRTKFVVEDSISGIREGDRLVPYQRLLFPAGDSEAAPRAIGSSVVAIGDGDKVLASLFDVVHLVPDERGSLALGDVVSLETPPGGLPSFDGNVDMVRAGRARVIAISPRAAAAVVTRVDYDIVIGSRTSTSPE